MKIIVERPPHHQRSIPGQRVRRIQVCLLPSLMSELYKLADREDRSLSNMAAILIKRGLRTIEDSK